MYCNLFSDAAEGSVSTVHDNLQSIVEDTEHIAIVRGGKEIICLNPHPLHPFRKSHRKLRKGEIDFPAHSRHSCLLRSKAPFLVYHYNLQSLQI